MARIVDLSRFMVASAAGTKAGQARRLRSRQGVDGQTLATRQNEDRRTGPLGGSIPDRISRASVSVTPTSFSIRYDDVTESFHRGDPGPPRPILGIPARERQQLARGAARETARQIEAALRRVG